MSDNYGKDPDAISRLTPEQYRVTQQNGTEPAFHNEYWDNKEPGLYVDVVVRRRDFRHLMIRTEVRSAHGGSHLGHVFRDGPAEAGGLRYCINSAALRFVPLDDLEREGYGAYRNLFKPPHPESAS